MMRLLVIIAFGGAVEEAPPPGPEVVAARKRTDVLLARHYQAAWVFYKANEYAAALAECEVILIARPDDLPATFLKKMVEEAIRSHKGKLLEAASELRDLEALREVELEARFPEGKPPVERPTPELREEVEKSDAMRKIEEKLNQRVSINFIDADLDYVLNTLFKATGVNIIAEQSVVQDKRITLHVNDLPLREILRYIDKNNDEISYTVTESAVWITTPDKPLLEARVYPLNKGIVSKLQFGSGARRTSGARTGISGASGTAAAARGAGIPGAAAALQQPQAGQQGQTQSFLEDVMDWFTTLEGEWPQGSEWMLDRQTNSLLAYTSSEVHGRISRLLDMIDTTPIQVLIRTKFIEVMRDDSFDLGVDFFVTDEGGPGDFKVGIGTGLNLGVSAGEGLSLVVLGKGTTPPWQATLNMMLKNENARLLSAPQIIALNNQMATIDVSTSFSYASEYQAASTVITSAGGVTETSGSTFVPSQFEQIDVGFRLEVVPSVGRDMKTITLDLHPVVDDILGGEDRFQRFAEFEIITPTEEGGGGGTTQTTQKIPRPIIVSREVMTKLVVQDGGVVAIGGLLRDKKTVTVKKVPILGDIPILGYLFRSRSETVTQSNLIIVVQASIITPTGQGYVSYVEAPLAASASDEWVLEVTPEERERLWEKPLEEAAKAKER